MHLFECLRICIVCACACQPDRGWSVYGYVCLLIYSYWLVAVVSHSGLVSSVSLCFVVAFRHSATIQNSLLTAHNPIAYRIVADL